MFSIKTRKWIYRILLAAFPVAAFYWPSLVPASPLWLALGLALLNVPPDDTTDAVDKHKI